MYETFTDMVKVEWEFSGNGAVESRLEESSKVLLFPAPRVILANTGHSAENCFATVGVLYRKFSEEEKGKVSIAHGRDKGRT